MTEGVTNDRPRETRCMSEFMGLTSYGLAYSLVVSLILYGLMVWKSKFARTKHGSVIALGVAFALGFLFIGPFTAPFIQAFTPVQLTNTGAPIQGHTEEGSLKLCVYDATSGSAITTGKIYLLDGSNEINVYDDIKDGDLKAGTDYWVLSVDTNGCAEFKGKTGSTFGTTYTWIYEPASFVNTGYPLEAGTVIAYDKTDDNGVLKAKGDQIQLYQMSEMKAFDPTSTPKSGYTSSSLTIDLNFKFGPTAENTGYDNVYLYVDMNESAWDSIEIYVNGQKLSLTKLGDLDTDNPLRKNAPSGADYVYEHPIISSLLLYDDKLDGRIKGTANGNTTMTWFWVQNANIEHGDVLAGSFVLTLDTTATSGWNS